MEARSLRLAAFDLDETLIHVGHKPMAVNTTTGQRRELDTALTEALGPDEVYDFSKFECLDTLEESVPVSDGLTAFNSLESGVCTIIITARTSFVNTEVLIESLIRKGYDADKMRNTAVWFAGDYIEAGMFSETPHAKAYVIENYIDDGYKHITFYDDSQPNIDAIDRLNRLRSDVYIKTIKT